MSLLPEVELTTDEQKVSYGFGLQFGAGDDIEDDVEDDIKTDTKGNEAPASESAEVVSLDSFRKSPS